MAECIRILLATEVGLGPGDIVLDGDLSPPPLKTAKPHPLFDHVCYGQTAGRIKIPDDMEVGISAGHIVLDGDPAPSSPEKRAQPPIFGTSIVPKRLYGSRCHLA